MKRKGIIFCVIGLIILIVFFPIPITRVISGDGDVLTEDKEKVGGCTLSIEIKEVASLAVCYSKRFSFTLDGSNSGEFASAYHTETDDGLCLISQMYYDEDKDRMSLCSLVYPEDLSYGVICWNERLYFVNNGTSISYAEIPIG